MKTFLALLVLCYLCRAQKHSSDILLQALNIDSKEGVAETQKPNTEASAVSLTQGDIWVELRNLRDMVVEQKVELRHLTARVTAAESQMETLQEENTAMEARMTTAERLAEELQMENTAMEARMTAAERLAEELQMENTEMEARMTAAESLAEELQMENDAQATEISTLRQRLNVSEHRVGELETQLEGLREAVQELQNTNTVRKVAFSSSLLTSGEGNTGNGDFVHLIYKNVISNIGNRYNPHTGYFTAPVRGVYYFRFTAHIAHSDSSLVMFLIKNGDMMVTSGDRYTTSTDPEDGICNGVVLQLEEGDVISVYISGKVWDDSSHRTTFSGFLLFLL